MRFLLPFFAVFASVGAQARADWRVTPVSPLHKLTASAPGVLEPFPATPVQLHAARGEWESWQFVVTAGEKAIEKLEITPNSLASVGGEFVRASNLHVWRQHHVFVAQPSGNFNLKPKWWPDALLPLEIAPQRIEAGKSAAFWASLRVPRATPPGDYFGEIDVVADGQPRRLALTLRVHEATLPPPTFRATVAVYYDTLRDWYRKSGREFSDEEWDAHKSLFYEFLLGFGLNAYDLPVAWNSPAVSDYLRNPRVRSVRVPPLDAPDFPLALEQLRAANALNKAFYYWIDEPAPERFAEVRQTTQKLRKLGIKHLVTVHPNEALKDAVDIWTPNIGDFFGPGHVDWKQLAAERKKGRETWLYTMVEPKWPYPTWLLDDSAQAVRDYGPLWAKNGVSGFVYSMAHGWGPNPFEDLKSFAGTNGDGTLFYPGELVGGVGPLPSIRLMLLRDALEDYELLRWTRENGRPALHSPTALRAAFLENYAAKLPIKSSLLREPKLFRDEPSSQKLAATGGGDLDVERSRANKLPLSRVGWKLKNDSLTVYFFAPQPREKDYVAAELAPRDGNEKWRFVVTAKGNTAVERLTREGTLRLPNLSFKSQVSPQKDAYRVEMTIPLADLKWANSGLRFDAFRATTTESGTRIHQRLNAQAGGDPFGFSLLPPPDELRD